MMTNESLCHTWGCFFAQTKKRSETTYNPKKLQELSQRAQKRQVKNKVKKQTIGLENGSKAGTSESREFESELKHPSKSLQSQNRGEKKKRKNASKKIFKIVTKKVRTQNRKGTLVVRSQPVHLRHPAALLH
jgi:hypothetical protein